MKEPETQKLVSCNERWLLTKKIRASRALQQGAETELSAIDDCLTLLRLEKKEQATKLKLTKA